MVGRKKKVASDKELIPKKEKLPSRGRQFDEEARLKPQPMKVGDYPSVATIESMINAEVKEESESKEIFNASDIEVKTELSDREISILSRLLFLCDTYELHRLEKSLQNFMKLRVSKNRKSRKEFIDSIKNPQLNNFPMGGNMNGQNSNMFR